MVVPAATGKELRFDVHSVAGARVISSGNEEVSIVYCPLRGRGRTRRKAHYRIPCDGARTAAQLADDIVALSLQRWPDMLKLWIIVNPFAGRKQAAQQYRQHVATLLSDVGAEWSSTFTKHKGHCTTLAQQADLAQCGGIILLGGDGVLSELLTGLARRGDAAIAMKTPIALSPSGSGNGLAKSLAASKEGPGCPIGATLAALKGSTCTVDAVQFTQGQREAMYAALSLAWGFAADVDIESEQLRSLGPARFPLTGVWRALFPRRYCGVLRLFTEDSQGWREEDLNECATVWALNVAFASEEDMPAPSATPWDGYLHVATFSVKPCCTTLGTMTRVRSGRHVHDDGVHISQAEAIELEPVGVQGATGGERVVIDGELIAQRGRTDLPFAYGPPIRGEVMPAALRMCVLDNVLPCLPRDSTRV